MEPFIPIIAACIGGGLALMGVAFSSRSNLKAITTKLDREDKDRARFNKIERGEELYALFSEWATFVISSDVSLFSVMRDEISYNQHLDTFIDSAEKQALNPHRIELLIHAYFPQLIQEYNDVLKENRVRNSIISGHKRSYKADRSGAEFMEPLRVVHNTLDTRSTNLKSSIVSELLSLTNP